MVSGKEKVPPNCSPACAAPIPFKEWLAAQTAFIGQRWALFHCIFLLIAFLGTTVKASGTFALADCFVMAIFFLAYTTLVIVLAKPQYAEVAFVCNGILRAIMATGIGLGYVPKTETLGHFRECGIEPIVEIFLFAAFEQVRPSWAILVAGFRAFGYWSVYRANGLKFSFLQATLEMGANLAIQAFVRKRYWSMYAKYVQSHTQSSAASIGKVMQRQGPVGDAQGAAVPVAGEQGDSKEDSAYLWASGMDGAPAKAGPKDLSSCLLDEVLGAKGSSMPLHHSHLPYRTRLKHTQVALTIHTPQTLSDLPWEQVNDLVSGIYRTLGSRVTECAIRSGCIVVSLNICQPSMGGSSGSSSSSAEQRLGGLCETMLDLARAWMGQQGLAAGGQAPLAGGVSIQVAHPIQPGSATAHLQALSTAEVPASGPSPPPMLSCVLRLPFPALLLPPAPGPSTAEDMAARGAGACSAGASCSSNPQQGWEPTAALADLLLCFEATLYTASASAPEGVDRARLGPDGPKVQVLGWGCQKDSPEEDEPEVLRLLAIVGGRFLPVHVHRHQRRTAAGVCIHKLQVSVSLPAGLAASPTGCLLSLELWGARALQCCCTTLLLPCTWAPMLAELQHWATTLREQGHPQGLAAAAAGAGVGQPGDLCQQDEELLAYVLDLGDWLQFIARCKQQQQQQLKGNATVPDAAHVQLLLLVGKDLLFYAVRSGMVSLAGMLLSLLMAPPFNATFLLLAMHTPAPASARTLGDDGPHSEEGPRPPPARSLLLPMQAVLSGSSAMVAQVLAWARTLGGPGFAWPWEEALGSGPRSLLPCLEAEPAKQALLWEVLEERAEGPSVCGLKARPLLSSEGTTTTTTTTAEAPGATAAAVAASAVAAATVAPAATAAAVATSAVATAAVAPAATAAAVAASAVAVAAVAPAAAVAAVAPAAAAAAVAAAGEATAAVAPAAAATAVAAAGEAGPEGSRAAAAAGPGRHSWEGKPPQQQQQQLQEQHHAPLPWLALASRLVLATLLCSQPLHEHAVHGRVAAHGHAACGKGGAGRGSNEASYRGWAKTQSAPIVRAWSRCWLAFLLVSSVRAACAEGWQVLHSELPKWLLGIAYAAAALLATPTCVESMVACLMLWRFVVLCLMGLGLLDIPPSFAVIFRMRLDILVEVFAAGMMEQARAPVLLCGRALLVFGSYLFYRQIKLPWAWTQAILVHAAGYAVSVLTEISQRHVYALRTALAATAAPQYCSPEESGQAPRGGVKACTAVNRKFKNL